MVSFVLVLLLLLITLFFLQVNTYLDFADNVLPRIHKLGYNAIQVR